MKILWVYAIGESLRSGLLARSAEAVDGSRSFSVAEAAGLSALYSSVDGEKYSQEEIDRRASDMAWLGEIGYRHQNVIGALVEKVSVIPLRAFTLFRNAESLRAYLQREAASLSRILDRIRDKEEWTVRLEFDHEQWSRALIRRVPELRLIQKESEKSGAGRGYLLRKKLDEERKKAAREAEEELVQEVEQFFARRLSADTIVENRERRAGSFPQINLLIGRSSAEELKKAHQEMGNRYAADGVRVVLTGPWPPYSFAAERADE